MKYQFVLSCIQEFVPLPLKSASFPLPPNNQQQSIPLLPSIYSYPSSTPPLLPCPTARLNVRLSPSFPYGLGVQNRDFLHPRTARQRQRGWSDHLSDILVGRGMGVAGGGGGLEEGVARRDGFNHTSEPRQFTSFSLAPSQDARTRSELLSAGGA